VARIDLRRFVHPSFRHWGGFQAMGRIDDTSAFILQLSIMRQHIGFLLQFAVLVFLPMLILWQLEFGFRLILMPALTLVGIVVFWIGYKLREG
jgi:hypothetical protein